MLTLVSCEESRLKRQPSQPRKSALPPCVNVRCGSPCSPPPGRYGAQKASMIPETPKAAVASQ
jgi:hypothetical protein